MESFFKQNYCHACHAEFAVFFPFPSCCVSSLMSGRGITRIYKAAERTTSTTSLLRKASLSCGEAGEKEKKSARGTMGRGKSEERLPPFPSSHRPPGAFNFLDYCYFIGIPSGSLCGGESSTTVTSDQANN